MSKDEKGTAGFPPQVRYIIGNEACERFSYYGMRSILVVFMIDSLHIVQEDARIIFHLFAGACYLMPLFGAYISDHLLGKYRTILWLSLFYCVGHLCLAVWENEWGLLLGLPFIALGAGGVKPCVSAFVGDQFTEENRHLIPKVFDLFYWMINFGAVFSTILMPFLLVHLGARAAFGVPGVLMGVATLIFWVGKKQYRIVPPRPRSKEHPSFLSVVWYALCHQRSRPLGGSFLDAATGAFSRQDIEGTKAVVAILKIFGAVSIFWSLFDQHGSSWFMQAHKMQLHIFGFHVEAAQIQALNPLMVMMLIPIFRLAIYPAFEALGIKVTPLRKMSLGMVLAGFSFVVVGWLEEILGVGVPLSVGWQAIPYAIITCAEIMVSITGLEFAYTQAPNFMKSTIMSFWFLTNFIGNLLAAFVTKLNVFHGPRYFYFFATLMFVVSCVFILNAMHYKVRSWDEAS